MNIPRMIAYELARQHQADLRDAAEQYRRGRVARQRTTATPAGPPRVTAGSGPIGALCLQRTAQDR